MNGDAPSEKTYSEFSKNIFSNKEGLYTEKKDAKTIREEREKAEKEQESLDEIENFK